MKNHLKEFWEIFKKILSCLSVAVAIMIVTVLFDLCLYILKNIKYLKIFSKLNEYYRKNALIINLTMRL